MEAIKRAIDTPPPRRRGFIITPVAYGVGAIVLVALIGGIAAYFFILRGSDVERGTRALVEAFSKRRIIEPRLSGGFKAAPYNRDGSDRTGIDESQLNKARDLVTEAAATGDAPALLAYGRLSLLDGKGPAALSRIREAVKRLPDSADAYNDLGVCLMEQEKIEAALAEFESALKCSPQMPEALFNRALCYEKLLLRDEAREGLIQLSNIERDKGWLREINERVATLSRPITQRKPDDEVVSAFNNAIEAADEDKARQISEENFEAIRKHVLINLWARQLESAVNREQDQAERYLSQIEFIGATFASQRNDREISDGAQYLRSLPKDERPAELTLIRDYKAGLGAFEARRLEEAQSAWERLTRAFESRGNSAFAETARFVVAQCHYSSKRIARSVEILQECRRRIEGRKWPYHRARVLLQLAIGYSRLGRDSLSIKECEQAIGLGANARENQAKAFQFLSLPYWHVGDLDTALARLRDSTHLYMEQSASRDRLDNLAYNHYQLADIHGLRNEHGLALLHAQKALEYAEEAENYTYSSEFASVCAVTHARLNQFDNAEMDLKRAFEYAGKLQPGRARDATEAFLHTNGGEVAQIKGDLQRALDSFAAAASLASRDQGNILPQINVLSGRAGALAASAQMKEAQSNLMRAVALIESYRISIDSRDQRSKFLGASQGVFDKLIWLNGASLGRREEAFQMSERSRARTLLEEMSRGQNDPSDPPAVPPALSLLRSQLPADLMVLEYSITSEGSLLFLVANSVFEMVRLPVTAEELDARVADYLSDIKNLAPLSEVNSKAQALYKVLVEPASRYLASHTLCIVPDKALQFLPFGALVDASGKYLVESHSITYAPSSATLIGCVVRGRSKPPVAQDRMLAVGNPQFRPDRFPKLDSLPDAAAEAQEAAAAYQPNSICLTGSEATEPAVRAALTTCTVAHLAVHCLVDEASPWLAALVLADQAPATDGISVGSDRPQHQSGSATNQPDSKRSGSPTNPTGLDNPGDGLLYLDEVYKLTLPNTRLVVLSACESGLGRYYRGEGMVSLVRPFLAAGVPTVVPSLWRVSSASTAQLMINFERQRKLPRSTTADALSEAQRQMAMSDSFGHPYFWAAFIVVGANY